MLREQIKRELRVREVDQFESYLGLPTLVGRAKYQTFSFLKDRVWKKIKGWKGKLLSRAGKEVLIKAVANQSLLTHWEYSFYRLSFATNVMQCVLGFGAARLGMRRKFIGGAGVPYLNLKRKEGWDLEI